MSRNVLIGNAGLLLLVLFWWTSRGVAGENRSNETGGGQEAMGERGSTTTPAEWESDKADSSLVEVVNFLMNARGREIELAGEKYTITGKEDIAVVVKVAGCCQITFNHALKAASACGKIESSNLASTSANALIPALKIPEMAESSQVLGIALDPKAKDNWLEIIERTALQ